MSEISTYDFDFLRITIIRNSQGRTDLEDGATGVQIIGKDDDSLHYSTLTVSNTQADFIESSVLPLAYAGFVKTKPEEKKQ